MNKSAEGFLVIFSIRCAPRVPFQPLVRGTDSEVNPESWTD